MTAVAGLDLSNNNSQTVDWPQVRAAGYEYLWHKIAEGNSYVDPYIDGRKARRIDDAQANGLDGGGYHFGRPSTLNGEPERQADFLCAHLPVGCRLRPVLDIEATLLDPTGTSRWTERFLWRMVANGFDPLCYTYSGFADRNFATAQLERFDLWLANYRDRNRPPAPPAPWLTYVAWQWTSTGTVLGIGYPIDLNVTNDLDALRVKTQEDPDVDSRPVAHLIVHKAQPTKLWLGGPQIEPRPVANVDVSVYVAFCSNLPIAPPPPGAVLVDIPAGIPCNVPQKAWSVDDVGARLFGIIA